MRRIGKWLGRILLVLCLALIATGLWKREEIKRLMAVNSLFAPDRIVQNFSNMDAAFLHVPVPKGDAPPSDLPRGTPATMPATLDSFVRDRHVTSLLVLRDGAVVFEEYYLGTGPNDLRIGWSLSKSFLSALTGILHHDGTLPDLDAQVTDWVPLLKGGAYDGATVRNVLHMATGVTFDEDYKDRNSDINRMGRILALGGEMDSFAAGLQDRFAPPGSDWKYTSIDTHVLGMVLRAASGRSLPDLMSEKIVRPLRLERAPYYLTDGTSVAFALGGINMTTRDYARFGQMYLQQGEWQGRQIVPADWIVTATTATAPTDPDQMGYGYQWWMPRDARPREYMGRGVYGQYLYINEPAGVVIVLTAADPPFQDRAVQRENLELFRAIADTR
ncbi:serine hydrolase [uncultured Roseobacter sp.]|uniref:serine hydrolase domain-containing protein n=1 Tax=uncultured Roseobacter sp. TaxID=114847 RepID=UPI00260B8494|nr:serine hydrolase [uncultured Roseobacter sp.]